MSVTRNKVVITLCLEVVSGCGWAAVSRLAPCYCCELSSGSEITRTEAGLRAELGLASEAVASDKPRTWSCSPLPGQTSDSEPGDEPPVMIRDKCCDAA